MSRKTDTIVASLIAAIYEYFWGAPKAIGPPQYNQENPSFLALEYTRLILNKDQFAQEQERRWLYGLGVALYNASWELTTIYPDRSTNDVQNDMARFGHSLGLPPTTVTSAITIWTLFEKAPYLLEQLGNIPNYHFNRMNQNHIKEISQYLEETLDHYHNFLRTEAEDVEVNWQDNWPQEEVTGNYQDDFSSSGESSGCLDNFEGYNLDD